VNPPALLLDDLPDADWLAAGWALRVTRVGIELPAWLRPEPLRGPTLLSPVHFELGTERIHLRRLTAALPGSEEMAALAEALQPLGLVLEPLQAEAWRLLDGAPAGELHAVPLPAMEGRSIGPLMPQPRNWHALMNEIQMLWHDHPVNRAREADGLPVVNAAWPWPRPQQAPLPRIASDDALVCWLAGSTPVATGAAGGSARA